MNTNPRDRLAFPQLFWMWDGDSQIGMVIYDRQGVAAQCEGSYYRWSRMCNPHNVTLFWNKFNLPVIGPIIMEFKSSWRILQSSLLLIFRYKIQSSAKSRTLELTFSGRSFMYSKNNKGPNTVPCGTSEVTFDQSDCSPPTTTLCKRAFRKFEIQVKVLPWIPYPKSLVVSLLCGPRRKLWRSPWWPYQLSSIIKRISQIVYSKNELRFTRMTLTKAMLLIRQYLMNIHTLSNIGPRLFVALHSIWFRLVH